MNSLHPTSLKTGKSCYPHMKTMKSFTQVHIHMYVNMCIYIHIYSIEAREIFRMHRGACSSFIPMYASDSPLQIFGGVFHRRSHQSHHIGVQLVSFVTITIVFFPFIFILRKSSIGESECITIFFSTPAGLWSAILLQPRLI